jgi:type II secretory pathway component PulF
MQKGNAVPDVEPAPSEGPAPLDSLPRWARLLIYSFAWLPVFFLLIGVVPRFDRIFRDFELNEKGELPLLTSWLMAFVHLDIACFHLPVVLVAITILAVDEAVMRWLRRRENGNTWSWRWIVCVGLAGFVAVFIIVLALLLPAISLTESLGR